MNLKNSVAGAIDGIFKRMKHRPLRRFWGSFDVLEIAQLKAAWESAEYYEQHMLTARSFRDSQAIIDFAMGLVPADGLLLEFGVASGRTITQIANAAVGRTVYGFDSFEGLPEDWVSGFAQGHFAGKVPEVPGNVRLVQGFFDDTLATFSSDHPGNVAFIHIDCDLYSSTKTIFDTLGDRIVKGTVLLFDEYWNYAGWKHHEHKAFMDFIGQSGKSYRYVAFVPSHQQVCVVID